MQGYVKYRHTPAFSKIDYGAHNQTAEDGYSRLANAIVHQAALDWRQKCNKLALYGLLDDKDMRGLYEIRRFFKSAWCGALCGNLDPLLILDRLEDELTAVQRKIARREAAQEKAGQADVND